MGRHTKQKILNQKRRKKLRLKKNVYLVLIIIFTILIAYSSFKIFLYARHTEETKDIEEELIQYVKIDEETNETIVDFASLKKEYDNIKAYLIVPGTNISYPLVQGKDNEYYLTHNIKNAYNSAGWVFIDYRNRLDGTDNNIVIYGHSMKNKTMFGELSKVLHSDWYSNEDNLYIQYITEEGTTLYKVFSIYRIPMEDYYINTNVSDEDFPSFIKTLTNRNIINLNTDTSSLNDILTLSTCYDNNNNRLVVHAMKVENIE